MARKLFSRRLGPRRGVLRTLLTWGRNLLLLAAVVVVGAKFYVDYRLGNNMDQWKNRSAPLGTMTYQDIYATFGGDIVLEGFSFLPDRAAPIPPLVVEKAILHTPGFLFILGFRGDDNIPESLGASVVGLRGGLSDLAVGGDSIEPSVSGIPFETLACGNVNRFQDIDMDAMGFGPLSVNLSARYRVDPPDRIDVQIIQENADAATLTSDIDLAVPNLADANRGRAAPDVRIKAITVAINASEFNKRRNQYCAESSETSVQQFLNNHMDEVLLAMAESGYVPGPSTMSQYQQFAEGEGTWTFQVRPDRPLQLTDLMVNDPLELVRLVNLNSSIGSRIPSPVTLTRAVRARAEGEDDSSDVPVVEGEFGLTANQGSSKRIRWVEVPVSSLGSYVGGGVRLGTRFGKQYTGRLIRIDADTAYVETRLPGGDATVPIPLSQLVEVRVPEFED